MAALHLAPQGFFQENLNSGQPARPCVAGAFPFRSVPLLLGSSHTHGLLCLPLMEVILAKGAPSPSVTLLLVSTTCLLCVDASGLLGCELRGQEGGGSGMSWSLHPWSHQEGWAPSNCSPGFRPYDHCAELPHTWWLSTTSIP